eukprot:15042858-Heterocapsa_arctica.AAC.1
MENIPRPKIRRNPKPSGQRRKAMGSKHHGDRGEHRSTADDPVQDELSPAAQAVPCKFFLRDRCRKGSSCRFRHSDEDRIVPG